MEESLVKPNQIRSYGLYLNDNPFDPSELLGIHNYYLGISIPFVVQNGVVSFKTRKPTEKERDGIAKRNKGFENKFEYCAALCFHDLNPFVLWHIATVTYCHRLAAWTERGELWQVFFHGFHRIPRQREINGRIINSKHIHVVYASDFTFKFKESALSLTAARTQVAWRDSFFHIPHSRCTNCCGMPKCQCP